MLTPSKAGERLLALPVRRTDLFGHDLNLGGTWAVLAISPRTVAEIKEIATARAASLGGTDVVRFQEGGCPAFEATFHPCPCFYDNRDDIDVVAYGASLVVDREGISLTAELRDGGGEEGRYGVATTAKVSWAVLDDVLAIADPVVVAPCYGMNEHDDRQRMFGAWLMRDIEALKTTYVDAGLDLREALREWYVRKALDFEIAKDGACIAFPCWLQDDFDPSAVHVRELGLSRGNVSMPEDDNVDRSPSP